MPSVVSNIFDTGLVCKPDRYRQHQASPRAGDSTYHIRGKPCVRDQQSIPSPDKLRLTAWCNDVRPNVEGYKESTKILHQVVRSGLVSYQPSRNAKRTAPPTCLRSVVDERVGVPIQPSNTANKEDLALRLVPIPPFI